MSLTKDEVKELNRERLSHDATERAEEYQARTASESQEGWGKFITNHSGLRAIQKGSVFVPCDANIRLLSEVLAERNLHVDEAGMNLEAIFRDDSVRNRLAKYVAPAYESKTTPRTPMKQMEHASMPAKLPPFTRKQYLEMSTAEMHRAIRRFGVDAVNKVLATR